jgi:hypothetical protein
MKTNHRRRVKSRQEYPWDLRSRKVEGFRFFRTRERAALERVRAGDDPDSIIWPTTRRHNDDAWHYD